MSNPTDGSFSSIPTLDLSLADEKESRDKLLEDLRNALFNVGFLYVVNHGVPQETIDSLVYFLPKLFDLPLDAKAALSKLNSPHFLGYSGFAEETTLGKQDLREQFDFGTELSVVWRPSSYRGINGHDDESESRDFSKLYWRLRGPNQWPPEELLPGFRSALTDYHDAVAALSYRFVHLVESAFDIPEGTFDHFFGSSKINGTKSFLPAQHRIKLLKYPPNLNNAEGQGVGAHKDSSGWLTFLYQVGKENALEVVNGNGEWVAAPPLNGSFVVNFGNAFEAATEGAVRATIHRVKATAPTSTTRYSIPFFQGLPLDLTLSEIRACLPQKVRTLRQEADKEHDAISKFLDSRWDNLGESQLRKWIRSHQDVANRHYSAADHQPREKHKSQLVDALQIYGQQLFPQTLTADRLTDQ